MNDINLPDVIMSDHEAYLAAIAGVPDIDLPVPMSRVDKWLAYIYNQIKMMPMNVEKLADHTYSIDYGKLDYEKAYDYFQNRYQPVSSGGCSSVRKDNLFGRNYDWYYNDDASFLVKTKKHGSRNATVGMMGGVDLFKADFVESGMYSDNYDLLPFFLSDGINDQGVVCSAHVVPTGDKGITTGTNPSATIQLCTLMLVRYVLDHADTAAEAITLLQGCNIYAPQSETFSQEMHFMIADADDTYIVEFVENEMVVIDTMPNSKAVMTNFYIDGFDGTTTTGFAVEGGIEPEDTTLTAHAMGVERYDILSAGYDAVSAINDMTALMQSVYYTKAYQSETTPYWYSEFTGETETFGELTVYQNAEDYADIVAYAQDEYAHRTRDGKTWQTVHTAVYDIESRSVKVYTQEGTVSVAEAVLDNGIYITELLTDDTTGRKYRIGINNGNVYAKEVIANE